MKRNIVITGGAGFIGSHVVRLFVNKYLEYNIINLDKLTYAGNLANLKDVEDKQLKVQTLGRGFAWLDTGTHDSLSEASTFVEVIEKRQGLKIACLEGIAYRKGWINEEKMRELAQPMIKNQYGQYLLKLINE